MKNLILFVSTLALFSACSNPPPQKTTVKITNLASNSGGSGSVVSHGTSGSEILTNAHVCEVVKNGGLVHESTTGKTHIVTSYKVSERHDLCLIKVSTDLKHSTSVSLSTPAMYESITTSGHPRLMPNILSKGHLSGGQNVQIMTGVRDCAGEDYTSPDTAGFCNVFGKLPIVKNYDAVAISSTIQPGSSGSAVYSKANEIVAVVFAGSGDFGYGYAVPHGYVYNFLKVESKALESRFPDPEVKMGGSKTSSSTHAKDNQVLESMYHACKEESINSPVCKIFKSVVFDQVERN